MTTAAGIDQLDSDSSDHDYWSEYLLMCRSVSLHRQLKVNQGLNEDKSGFHKSGFARIFGYAEKMSKVRQIKQIFFKKTLSSEYKLCHFNVYMLFTG